MDDNEKALLDDNGNPAERKVKMRIKKQPDAIPLTEEQKDKDEKLAKTRRTSKINQIVQHFKGLFAKRQPKEQNSQSEER